MLFVIGILIFGTGYSKAISKEALHDAMTEAEMAYYFQTADSNLIPEYELVELPLVLPVTEAVSSSGDNVEEIEYSFSAFQR